tara:strand:+ start:539 stop:820 length:282 start_codon:yes stop_codon:yes gene_type:complete
MADEEFNADDLPPFVFPEKFLEQIFEFSGSTDGNKGFLLAFVNQDGSPMIYTRTDNQIIEMGLRKALEKYLIDAEEAGSRIDHPSSEDDIPPF